MIAVFRKIVKPLGSESSGSVGWTLKFYSQDPISSVANSLGLQTEDTQTALVKLGGSSNKQTNKKI